MERMEAQRKWRKREKDIERVETRRNRALGYREGWPWYARRGGTRARNQPLPWATDGYPRSRESAWRAQE